MDRFQVGAELRTLQERCRDILIQSCLAVEALVAEGDIKVADTFDISERCVVSQHKEAAVPLVMSFVDILDLRYCLPEKALVRKPQPDRFIDYEIVGIIEKSLIAQRAVKVEPVPVGAVVAVHTEYIVTLVSQHLLYSRVVSVPVIYRDRTA